MLIIYDYIGSNRKSKPSAFLDFFFKVDWLSTSTSFSLFIQYYKREQVIFLSMLNTFCVTFLRTDASQDRLGKSRLQFKLIKFLDQTVNSDLEMR